jgi:hypothetical protein
LRATVFKTASSANRTVSFIYRSSSGGPNRTDANSFKASCANLYTTPQRVLVTELRATGSAGGRSVIQANFSCVHRRSRWLSSHELRRLGSNQRGTCLTGTRNYQQLPLRNESARLDSNQRSRRPKRRGMTIFPTHSHTQKRPAGVEPALPPWQGSRLPLHHGRRLFGK